MKIIEWNPDVCAGCGTCEAICSFVHEQECNPTLSRIKIVKERKFGQHIAYVCLQCAEAYCIETCPRKATHRDEITGTILVDKDICRGCGACVVSCPVFGVHIANREKPPCEIACPLTMDIQGYVGLIAEGKVAEAYKLIRKTNPLPSICGRVCRNPCEEACQRNYVDEPVAIRALKRFATDNADITVIDIPKITKNGIKVAVVGSGPAGLTAAHDLAWLGYQVTVFESLPEPGGALRVGIPEYRLPKEILRRDIDYIGKLGVDIRTGVKLGEDITLDELQESYKAICLATGAHKSLTLGVAGEATCGVIYGIDFLRAVNLGQPVELGKRVLVVGGGNVAIDCARTARRLGAAKVDIACLESYASMPADKREVKQAESEGITIHPSQAVSRITGNVKVAGVEFLDVRSMRFDEDRKLHVDVIAGSEHFLPAETVIVAIGQTSGLPDWIKTDMKTVKSGAVTIAFCDEGIFIAGDAVNQTTVVEAMAAGRQVARSIDSWLNGIPVSSSTSLPAEKLETLCNEDVQKLRREWGVLERVEARTLSPLISVRNFAEVEQSYSLAQAREEAGRCACCVGTVLKCDLCGGDPECVKWCGNEALTIKEVDSVSVDQKVAYLEETSRRLSQLESGQVRT